MTDQASNTALATTEELIRKQGEDFFTYLVETNTTGVGSFNRIQSFLSLLYAIRLTLCATGKEESEEEFTRFLQNANKDWEEAINAAHQLGIASIRFGSNNLEWDDKNKTWRLKGHSNLADFAPMIRSIQ